MSVTAEDKNIVTGIKNSLKRDTKFMYFDGIEYKPTQDVKETRAESVEFKVVQGTYFTADDYFILKEVHNLGVTNAAIMAKRLLIEKRNNPEKNYPDCDYHKLLSRMRFLVRQGLLYSYEYNDTSKKNLIVFTCTSYGWRLYKNKLCLPDVYDKNIHFKAETEIFKRLASNAVAYAFAILPNCNSVIVNDNIPYGKYKRSYIYARATLGEEEKALFVVEPVYFNVDNKMVSEEENEARIISRLTQLEEVITYLNTNNQTKLIICVENYSGLTKLIKILASKDINFYCNFCYFTSENVLFESSDELSKSFLKLSVKEDKYLFSLAKDQWF